jgi:hypothetical protein
MEQQREHLFDIQIDPQTQAYLGESARWGKFLSIVGFIMCGLMVIVALFAGRYMANSLRGVEGMAEFSGGAFTAAYLIVAAIWFFPCLYLYNYSTRLQMALRGNDQFAFTTAFKNLKSCLKFMGVCTIIGLCFYALFFLIMVGATVVSR